MPRNNIYIYNIIHYLDEYIPHKSQEILTYIINIGNYYATLPRPRWSRILGIIYSQYSCIEQ